MYRPADVKTAAVKGPVSRAICCFASLSSCNSAVSLVPNALQALHMLTQCLAGVVVAGAWHNRRACQSWSQLPLCNVHCRGWPGMQGQDACALQEVEGTAGSTGPEGVSSLRCTKGPATLRRISAHVHLDMMVLLPTMSGAPVTLLRLCRRGW